MADHAAHADPLEAVVAAPRDDAPRLAYADAVEPVDPARAELIRIQVDLARRRRMRARPEESGAALEREFRLIGSHGRTWAAELVPLLAGWQYLRGFVEVARLDAADFLARAPEIFRRAPVLHLDLTGVGPVAAELFTSPHLRRIVSLNLIRNDLGDAEAVALAGSPHLAGLEWLDLGGNRIGAEGLEALAASDRLPGLGYLGFRWNAVDDPTPVHADEWDADTVPARALQQRYGPRAWLDARSRPAWPPERDAVR